MQREGICGCSCRDITQCEKKSGVFKDRLEQDNTILLQENTTLLLQRKKAKNRKFVLTFPITFGQPPQFFRGENSRGRDGVVANHAVVRVVRVT